MMLKKCNRHLTTKNERDRCKVRMSGLCKVEMSGFMGGWGTDGNGAHRDEPTRTGPVASVAGGKAKAFDAGRSGAAAKSDRPPRTADVDPHWRARGWRDRSPTTGSAIEPQAGSAFGAEDSGADQPSLCGPPS